MADLGTKIKERIEKELWELLECDNWDGRKLNWVYQLCDIMKDIHAMEEKTQNE